MTPIEREIRLHQEREETLRRQRGMASPRSTQEYVEVRMKPILSQAQLPAQLPKDKERQWAGAQMQREIQRERLREEDLMHMGQVRGTYDRGTPQELQEKKMLFEKPARTQGSPFFRLRSRSPQSRLELEVQEAQKREEELQKQRHCLYGWVLPRDAQRATDGQEPRRSQPGKGGAPRGLHSVPRFPHP
uniref:MISP family member 3 n=1 Tax=Gopherus evgoodei TaxID=1825980 RepID=A0A8C5EY21_9SAUR